MKAWNYLSSGWSNFSLPSNIQKRLYKFLLRRAIGQFLANELDLENFDIELVNGSVELRDLALNLQALNDCIVDTPFILEEGHVASISATLPWSNFWSGDISLKVNGLRLTLRPAKDRPRKQAQPTEDEESPIMSSSLHFADDFLRTEMEPDQNQELYESIQQSLHDLEGDSAPAADNSVGVESDGLQVLTRVIDKMLAKVKVDVSDTLVRIVHKSVVPLAADPCDTGNEYSLDIHLPKISYFDETPEFNTGQSPPSTTATMAESSVLIAPTVNETIKIITLASPAIWIRSSDTSQPLYNMPFRNENEPRNLSTEQNAEEDTDVNDDDPLSQTEFYEAEDGTSSIFYTSTSSSHMSGSTTPRAFPNQSSLQAPALHKPYAALLFTTMDKESWIRLKLHSSSPFDSEASNFAQTSSMKQLDFLLTHIRITMTPCQTAFLLDLIQNIMEEPISSTEKVATASEQAGSVPSTRSTTPLSVDTSRPASELPSNPFTTLQRSSVTPSSSTLSSSVSQSRNTTTQPSTKIKLQVSRLEIFFLYDDNVIPLDSPWSSQRQNIPENISHLNLTVDQIIIRLQQFPNFAEDKKDTSKPKRYQSRHSEAGSGSSSSYYSHSLPRMERLHASKSTHTPFMSSSNTMLSKILDIRISNIKLREWLARPSGFQNHPEANDQIPTEMEYETYIPVLEFDDRIKSDYDDTFDFPVIPIITRTTKPGAENDKAKNSKVDAIRVRIETKRTLSRDGMKHASFDEDISADVQSFKLQIDARITDRLESYILAIFDQQQTKSSSNVKQTPSEPDHFSGQNVYDDLDRLSAERRDQSKTRVRCAFIRVILLVPDMSKASIPSNSSAWVRPEFFTVDLKKVAVSWSGNSDHTNDGIESKEPNSASSMHYQTAQNSLAPSAGTTTSTINAEVNCINVFLKLAQEHHSQCWFTAKTIVPQLTSEHLFKAEAQSPTVEIAIRSPKSTFVPSSRAGYFGSGSDIPSNLFEHLSRNESFESNQKLHVPMEDQAESAMMFKQRTVETALFVVNCHLPQTRMKLSKQTWDMVQILQNDLLLWQPQFLAKLPASQTQTESRISSRAGSMHDIFSDTSQNQYFDAQCTSPTKASSVLSQSHERLGQFSQVPSLFALVAVLGDSIWDIYDLDSTAQYTYRLHMNEFRYFATFKHQGQNENITTLDIDELSLDDITRANVRIPLLYKTLPKNLTPKRNTTMVSLFSRLVTMPELNRQRKETSIVACNICWRFTPDVSFLENLIQFQKASEHMVYINPPAQHIKVYAHVLDLSIDYKPINIPSRGALVIDDLQVITELIAGAPVIDVKTSVQSIDFFLIDDVSELTHERVEQLENKVMDSRRYWMTLGLPRVLYLRNLETLVKIKSSGTETTPKIDVSVLNNTVKLECCADSFQSLVNFITYSANDGDGVMKETQAKPASVPSKDEKRPSRRRQSNVSLYTTHKEDMLASVDEDAFRLHRQSRDITSSRVDSLQSSTPLAAPELGYVESYYSSSNVQHGEHSASFRPQKPRRRKADRSADDVVRVLVSDMEELEIQDDFFRIEKKRKETYRSTLDTSRSAFSVRIRDFDVCWNMHDGCDWAYMRGNSHGPKMSPQPARSMSSFGSAEMSRTSSIDTTLGRSPHDPSQFLAHSPTFSLSDYGASQPSDHDDYSVSASPRMESPQDKKMTTFTERQRNRRRLRRSHTAQVEIKMEGISVNFDLMAPGDQQKFHLWLAIRDVEILDNIKTSTWKTFLGYKRPDASSHPRERGSVMVDIELTAVRPIPTELTQELLLKVSLLPIRLYIDQDALNFLVQYFTFDKSILRSTEATNATIPPTAAETEDEDPIFFQHVDIHPIALKVDYKPKYINYGNIKEGQLSELINLFHLDGAELTLSRVKLTGVEGLTGLADKLAQQWLPHIKNTQVPHMVSGVSPIRSIVNLGTGVADLVLLPIQQYRKDGRIIKGLQRGTQSFARATAMEAIKLSARFASGTQVILEHADGLLSRPPAPSGSSQSTGESSIGDTHYVYLTDGDPLTNDYEDDVYGDEEDGHDSSRHLSRYARQPSDLSQGLQYAYHNLSRNIGSAAQTIFAIPTEIKDRDGTARAVIKAVPVAVIKPMIGLTGALQSILAGLRNTIDPAKRLQNEDKYKYHGPSTTN